MDEPHLAAEARPGQHDVGSADPLPALLRRLAVVTLLAAGVAVVAAAALGRSRLIPAGVICAALSATFVLAARLHREKGARPSVTIVVVALLGAGVPLALTSSHIATVPITIALFAVLIALPYYRPEGFVRLSVIALIWTAAVVWLREFVVEPPRDLPEDYVAAINVVANVSSGAVILYVFSKVRARLTALAANAQGVEIRYRALVEQLPAVTFIDEVTGPGIDDVRPLYMSPQAEEMFGYPLEAWSEPTFWRSVIHPDDRAAATHAGQMAGDRGEPFSAEYRIVHADGHPVWVLEESVPISVDGESMLWQGVIFDITVRRNAEKQRHRSFELLRRTDAERRRLLAQLVTAQEKERRRIAAEIHDDPVQKMTAVGIRLDMLRATLDEPEHLRSIEQVQESVRLAVRRMRELMFELRPPELDRAGLAAAIREFATHMSDPDSTVGIRINVEDRLAIEPGDEVSGVAYRILVEALTNAARHSRASEVDVLLTEVDGGLLMRVRDDGVGIENDVVENGRPGHLGLVSVRERAEMLGGWSRIVSGTGGGTTVEAWLPVARPLGRLPFEDDGDAEPIGSSTG